MSEGDSALSNAYFVLEVVEGASEGVVRLAFKARALQTHPDSGGSQAEFQRVEAAMALIESAGFPPPPGAAPSSARRTCLVCGRQNNVAATATEAKCGACGERLLWGVRLRQEVATLAGQIEVLVRRYSETGRNPLADPPASEADTIRAYQTLRTALIALVDDPQPTPQQQREAAEREREAEARRQAAEDHARQEQAKRQQAQAEAARAAQDARRKREEEAEAGSARAAEERRKADAAQARWDRELRAERSRISRKQEASAPAGRVHAEPEPADLDAKLARAKAQQRRRDAAGSTPTPEHRSAEDGSS